MPTNLNEIYEALGLDPEQERLRIRQEINEIMSRSRAAALSYREMLRRDGPLGLDKNKLGAFPRKKEV